MSHLFWNPLLSCGSPVLAAWPLELPLLLALVAIFWRGRGELGRAGRQAAFLLGLSAFWLLPALERIQVCGWRWPVPQWTHSGDEQTKNLGLMLRENRLAAADSKVSLRPLVGLLPLNSGSAAESRYVSLVNRLIADNGVVKENLLSLSGVIALSDGQKPVWRSPAVRAAFVNRAIYHDKGPQSAAAEIRSFYSRPLFLEDFNPQNSQTGLSANWTLLSPDIWEATQVAVDLPPHHPDGWLFLGDTWYPGWKAWVDGSPRPILRAEIAFRSVRVLANEQRVIFRFRPFSFTLGLGISLLTLAFLIWPRFFKLLFQRD